MKTEHTADKATQPNITTRQVAIKGQRFVICKKFIKSIHGFCAVCKRDRWPNEDNKCRKCEHESNVVKFRVDRYAVICPSGQLLQRYRTLDLSKRVCKILNDELTTALEREKHDSAMLSYITTHQADVNYNQQLRDQHTTERELRERAETNMRVFIDKEHTPLVEQLREQLAALVDALRQIGLLAGSGERGDPPQLKLDAISRRCEKELAQVKSYPLSDGRTK